MLEAGLTANGGAIHSAEQILNILGLRLCYPVLTHINNLRSHSFAPLSEEALAAHRAGEKGSLKNLAFIQVAFTVGRAR